MARKRYKAEHRPCELNLTAMIDVAFQLLSFFLIAIKPVDVLANLEAFRPSPERTSSSAPSVPMIKIMVLSPDSGISGYVVNDTSMTMSQVENRLRKYADTDPTQTVLIMCSQKSTHKQLIELLDRCAKYKMTNLSVVSLAGN